jgi:hypothetical protein
MSAVGLMAVSFMEMMLTGSICSGLSKMGKILLEIMIIRWEEWIG